jgi:hypothetical protein
MKTRSNRALRDLLGQAEIAAGKESPIESAAVVSRIVFPTSTISVCDSARAVLSQFQIGKQVIPGCEASARGREVAELEPKNDPSTHHRRSRSEEATKFDGAGCLSTGENQKEENLFL